MLTSGKLSASNMRLPTYIEATKPQNTFGCSFTSVGPGGTPWIISAAISTAVIGPVGRPSASMGTNAPVDAALLADSGSKILQRGEHALILAEGRADPPCGPDRRSDVGRANIGRAAPPIYPSVSFRQGQGVRRYREASGPGDRKRAQLPGADQVDHRERRDEHDLVGAVH